MASIDLAQPIQVGHTLGLFGYAFGIFAAWLWLASFRTSVIVVLSLASFPSCAELCEASYKRSVLPVWPLAKH